MGGNSGNDSSAFAWYKTKASRRAGRATVVRNRRHLSERDMHVIGSIDRYRYLSARQIEELHFFDHASSLTGARACRCVLERLTTTDVLRRLDRRIGGTWAGSVSYIYALAPLGYRLLRSDRRRRVRRREPSAEFLDHTLE